ncbi:MAG: PDZ domain-containing protein [Planctomycetota bacterium]
MRPTLALSSLACAALLPAQDESPPPGTSTPAATAAATSDPVATSAAGAPRYDVLSAPAWRALGPANPTGRITDLAVHPSDTSKWFVGTAGGGVFVTDNRGTTWSGASTGLASMSIGDVAVAPSDPAIVWVGTGEENARNSVQWGDGVYKSTDGGKTFAAAGLRDTFQIGHVEIHPTEPDTVYVAALGTLWSPNAARGVYRTRDGGQSWEHVLFVDEDTGCIDVRLDPAKPSVVLACMYERRRDRFDGNDPAVRFGENAGLWRSEDGGDTWARSGPGSGLPTCQWGRSGLDVRSGLDGAPSSWHLIVETERSGWATGDRKDREDGDPIPPEEQEQQQRRQRQGRRQPAVMGIGGEGADGDEDAPGAVLTEVTDDGAAAQAGLQPGDRITRIDDTGIADYGALIEFVRGARGGQEVQVTYVRVDEAGADVEATAALTFGTRGQTVGGPNGPYGARLNGQRANVQDYQGDHGFETGGVFRSDNGGASWARINSLTERPFYYSVLRTDPQDPQHLYAVGTSLWASHDGGATFAVTHKDIHVDFHAIWIDPHDGRHLLAGCDGGVNESFDRGATWQVHAGFCAAQYYDVTADNSEPYNVIGGLQDNGTWVGPSRTRYREGITWHDWKTVYGGDGFGAVTDPEEPWILFCTSQGGALGMLDLRSGRQTRIRRERPDGEHAKVTPKFNWDAPFALSPHNRLLLWSAGTFLYRSDRYAHLDQRERGGPAPLQNADGLRAEVVSPPLGLTDAGTATALAESPLVRGLLYVGTDDGALWRREPDGAWTELHAHLPAMPGPRYVSDLWPSQHAADRVYVTLDGHRDDDRRTYVLVSEDRGATWASLATGLPSYEPCYAFAEDPRNQDLLFLGTEYGCHASLDRGARWQPLGRDLPITAVRDLFVHDRDGDLIAATHGQGVFVLDIAPLRQWNDEVVGAATHLFAPEDAVLWRMTSRGMQGDRGFRADNPPYGVAFWLFCAAPPAAAPKLTVHDVTGAKVAEVEAAARAGLQRVQWDARLDNRLAPTGSYSVRLADGDDTQVRAFRLRPDPEQPLPDDTALPAQEDDR